MPILGHWLAGRKSAHMLPSMMAAALVFPAGISGAADMSATRRPNIPRTCIRVSRTASRSSSAPILAVPQGWKFVLTVLLQCSANSSSERHPGSGATMRSTWSQRGLVSKVRRKKRKPPIMFSVSRRSLWKFGVKSGRSAGLDDAGGHVKQRVPVMVTCFRQEHAFAVFDQRCGSGASGRPAADNYVLWACVR